MDADRSRLPLLVTPLVAKASLYQLIERTMMRRERFLIVRRREAQSVLIGIDDLLEISGLGQQWLEDAWAASRLP